MAKIIVFDEAGEVRPNATFELMFHAFYAGKPKDIADTLHLLNAEEKRCREVGLENYQPGDFAQSVIRDIQKKLTQPLSAGLVALGMVELGRQGKKMSLNAAAKWVAEFAGQYEHGQVLVHLYRNAGYEVHSKSLLRHHPAIESNFRKYRSAAHICGALASVPSVEEFPRPFEPNPEAHARFVSTVIEYQILLRKATTYNDWGLQELYVPESFDRDRYPPYDLNMSDV